MTRILKILLMVGLVGVGPAEAPDAEEVIDLPNDEIRLTTGIPQVEAPDSWPMVFALPDGQLCVLHQEGYRLRAIHLVDGGLSFGSEIDVAGMPATPDVFFYQAVLADDGYIYAALITADPGGYWGLQFVRSADMGRNWSTPTTLVTESSPGYGLFPSSPTRSLAIDAGVSGQVAIAYRSVRDDGLYITTSTDMGTNWSQPVRLDSPPAPWPRSVQGFDIAIDRSNGDIHVAFGKELDASYDLVVWTTRSSDFGATFDPARSLSDLVPEMDYAYNLDVAVARDGSVLIVTACHDVLAYGVQEVILAFRSSDSGATYERVFEYGTVFRETAFSTQPRVAASATTDTVLIVYPDLYGLAVIRSGDNGASFGDVQLLEYSFPDVWVQEDISIAQTEGGSWAVAWVDQRHSYYTTGNDVYVRLSTDDALTWEPEIHANSILKSVAFTNYSGHKLSLFPVGPGEYFTVFTDNREDDRNFRVWGAKITAADPSSPMEIRIDSGDATVEAPGATVPVIASDGSAWLYVGFAVQDGPGTIHWYVRSSHDGGMTLSEPIRLPPAVDGWPSAARLHATEDGHVYLLYRRYVQSGYSYTLELRLNRSEDYGQTWLDEDIFVHEATSISSLSLSLGIGSNGRVLIAWEERTEIFLARSEDEGDHFEVTSFDLGTDHSHDYPALCVANDRVYLAWVVENYSSSNSGIFAAVSEDGGATFSEPVHLHATLSGSPPSIACGEHGEAVAAWGESGKLWTSRHDGVSWMPKTDAPLADVFISRAPRIAYIADDYSRVLAVSGSYSVHSLLSIDGGASFSNGQQLDIPDNDPYTSSSFNSIASDGKGNVWVSWSSNLFGYYRALIMRRSVDGGNTFGTAWRVNSEPYPGTHSNTVPSTNPNAAAALPAAGFFVWMGQRESPFYSMLFNRDLLNSAPDANCRNVTVSADETCAADANVDDGSFDQDGDPITLSQSPPGPYPHGDTSVILTVIDDKGASDTCEATVTVVDDTPPSLSVTLDPDVLWPPNHRMVDIVATLDPTDNCGTPSVVLTSVLSNEADNGHGDGNTVNDIQDTETGTRDTEFRLRAERAAGGNGRIYTAVYSATDSSGNVTPWTGSVQVPHDRGGT